MISFTSAGLGIREPLPSSGIPLPRSCALFVQGDCLHHLSTSKEPQSRLRILSKATIKLAKGMKIHRTDLIPLAASIAPGLSALLVISLPPLSDFWMPRPSWLKANHGQRRKGWGFPWRRLNDTGPTPILVLLRHRTELAVLKLQVHFIVTPPLFLRWTCSISLTDCHHVLSNPGARLRSGLP